MGRIWDFGKRGGANITKFTPGTGTAVGPMLCVVAPPPPPVKFCQQLLLPIGECTVYLKGSLSRGKVNSEKKCTNRTNGVFTPEQDKTNVEPVHFYDAFHTRSDKPDVKGIIGMHRFNNNYCLVVLVKGNVDSFNLLL